MACLSEFIKTKDFLICVDSDGCVMDTMDIKHFKCFGPCMVKEWHLDKWRDEILNRWNELNLFTLTRGINRFKGLATALEEINAKYCEIESLDTLCEWVRTSDELSNEALERAIAESDSISLKKALNWSKSVNSSIKQLPEEELKPFPLAKEALQYAHKYADVAIVSSANLGAVLEEWGRHGLLPHTDIVLAQDSGSKAFCIGELAKKGYKKENILMCGDALGDLQAAQKNGVYFYPILVKREAESWQEFIDSAVSKLTSLDYEDYQNSKIKNFKINLGANE